MFLRSLQRLKQFSTSQPFDRITKTAYNSAEYERINELKLLCSMRNQKFLNCLIKYNENNGKEQKRSVSEELRKKCDVGMIEKKQSDLIYILAISLLRRSSINNRNTFIGLFASIFMHKALQFSFERDKTQLTLDVTKSDPFFGENIEILNKNRQFLIEQLVRGTNQVVHFYEDARKIKIKSQMVQFLWTNRECINKFETIMEVLGFLYKLGDNRKIFIDSLRLGRIFEYFLNKIKKLCESNQKYRVINYSYNQFPNKFTFNFICTYLSKYVIQDESIIKYFVKLICSDEFLVKIQSSKQRLLFYLKMSAKLYQYQDQQHQNLLTEKVKKIINFSLKKNLLQRYRQNSEINMLINSFIFHELEVKYHRVYKKIKKQIIEDLLVIVEKPTPPSLTKFQEELIVDNYKYFTQKVIILIIRKYYPQILKNKNIGDCHLKNISQGNSDKNTSYIDDFEDDDDDMEIKSKSKSRMNQYKNNKKNSEFGDDNNYWPQSQTQKHMKGKNNNYQENTKVLEDNVIVPFNEQLKLYIHNQFMNRVGYCLKKIGIKYQKEVSIPEVGKNEYRQSRQQTQQPQQQQPTEQQQSPQPPQHPQQYKIIIECDGDYHINFTSLEISPRTSMRNMLFMLAGYRVIEIGIHEFNNTHTNKDLQKIIYKKLQILEKYNAYAVA